MSKENILNEGLSLYNKKNYTGALTYFLSLPDDASLDALELSYYLGLCYARLGRYDDALLYLEQVVTSSQDSKEEAAMERVLQCRYLLAVIYCLTGRKKLADFELNKLLEMGYKPASVYASLAFIAWEQGNSDLSVTYYEMALDDDAQNPTALNGLGYVLACRGQDLTKALNLCKKAVDILPESPACLDSLGWVYYKMGLYTESKKYLGRAMKVDAANPIIAEHLQEVQKVEE